MFPGGLVIKDLVLSLLGHGLDPWTEHERRQKKKKKALGESLWPQQLFKVCSKCWALSPHQPVHLKVFNLMN